MSYNPSVGGGGAPTDATYITQTANGTLSAEQALSTLTTGIVKVTNGTGALSTATAGTDYAAASHTHAQADVTNLTTDLAAKQPDIQFKDEGVAAGSSGGVTVVDFVGAGVSAAEAAGVLTVTIGGAGGGNVTGDDTTTTAQNIVAYSGTGGLNVTELTGTQGDVLYHNGTSWSKLGAGTAGYLLKTAGAGGNPSWTAPEVAPLAAAQADQETATSTTTFVSPGRQQFHPSAAKFWVKATGNSTTIVVSYNMTSWADTGIGDADGTIATDFSTANWCGSVSIVDATLAWDATYTEGYGFDAMAAGTFGVKCGKMQDGGTAAATVEDPDSWLVMGFGNHT